MRTYDELEEARAAMAVKVAELRDELARLRAELATANRFIDSMAESHEASDKACIEARAELARERVTRSSLVQEIKRMTAENAAMREELAVLRKVAKAARIQGKEDRPWGAYFVPLTRALSAYDALLRKQKDG